MTARSCSSQILFGPLTGLEVQGTRVEGRVVLIEARSGPIQVTASGEALEPGRQGDVVRVRNVNTGKVIRARVVDTGTVQPADMP